MAHEGATLASRGPRPTKRAPTPSARAMASNSAPMPIAVAVGEPCADARGMLVAAEAVEEAVAAEVVAEVVAAWAAGLCCCSCCLVLTTSSGVVAKAAMVPEVAPAAKAADVGSSLFGELSTTRRLMASYESQYMHEKGTSRQSVGTRPRQRDRTPSSRTRAVAIGKRPPALAARVACIRVRNSSSGETTVEVTSLAAPPAKKELHSVGHCSRHDISSRTRSYAVRYRVVAGTLMMRPGRKPLHSALTPSVPAS
eukprot:6187060-Pleurochrysis_carterae.AAC.2